MDVRSAARQLARAVLEADEGENPRDFLKKHAPHTPHHQRYDKVPQEYEWEQIGLCNSDYFQGRGTAFTNWDDVYVGAGDNPAEAASDALEQAASYWKLDTVEEIEDTEPSAHDEIVRQLDQEAQGELDRDDFETDEEYNEAVQEKVAEMVEMGDFNLYYYVALYLREYNPDLD